MRVLLISQEMPPETGWGGIGTYVATLAPALAEAGATVRVLSVVRGQADRDEEVDGFIVHRRALRRPRGVGRVTTLHEAWERVSLAISVDRKARQLDFDPDVVEAPDWRAESLVLGWRRGSPLVVRLHSLAAQLFGFVERPTLDARLAAALERRALVRADLITSTGAQIAAVRGHLGKRMPPVREIPLPVPRYTPAEGPSSVPVVTFVGRLERVKGPDVLLAAAARVLDSVPDARFVFIGADTGRAPGSFRALLEAEAKRTGVIDAVEFTGHLPHAAALDRIRESAVCAFPSRQESFGLSAAEASMVGKPVVASMIPAYSELFAGDGAVLIEGEDPRRWASALTSMLTDRRAAQDLCDRGRQRMLDRCAPDRVAAATLDAYADARRLARVRG